MSLIRDQVANYAQHHSLGREPERGTDRQPGFGQAEARDVDSVVDETDALGRHGFLLTQLPHHAARVSQHGGDGTVQDTLHPPEAGAIVLIDVQAATAHDTYSDA